MGRSPLSCVMNTVVFSSHAHRFWKSEVAGGPARQVPRQRDPRLGCLLPRPPLCLAWLFVTLQSLMGQKLPSEGLVKLSSGDLRSF